MFLDLRMMSSRTSDWWWWRSYFQVRESIFKVQEEVRNHINRGGGSGSGGGVGGGIGGDYWASELTILQWWPPDTMLCSALIGWLRTSNSACLPASTQYTLPWATFICLALLFSLFVLQNDLSLFRIHALSRWSAEAYLAYSNAGISILMPCSVPPVPPEPVCLLLVVWHNLRSLSLLPLE